MYARVELRELTCSRLSDILQKITVIIKKAHTPQNLSLCTAELSEGREFGMKQMYEIMI